MLEIGDFREPDCSEKGITSRNIQPVHGVNGRCRTLKISEDQARRKMGMICRNCTTNFHFGADRNWAAVSRKSEGRRDFDFLGVQLLSLRGLSRRSRYLVAELHKYLASNSPETRSSHKQIVTLPARIESAVPPLTALRVERPQSSVQIRTFECQQAIANPRFGSIDASVAVAFPSNSRMTRTLLIGAIGLGRIQPSQRRCGHQSSSRQSLGFHRARCQ
jgi:hypothetical protein